MLWNFTVLGEAASQLSEEIRAAHPDVEWHRPVSLRNRIVHGYWSVEMEILTSTAANHIPSFVRSVRSIRESEEAEE